MADTLVELSTKPWFREGVKQLELPIPTPQKLKRSEALGGRTSTRRVRHHGQWH